MDHAIRLLSWGFWNRTFLVLVGIGVFAYCAYSNGVFAQRPDAPSLPCVRRPSNTAPADDSSSLNMPTVVSSGVSRPLQILALSGGAAGAPFTAGVLVGWTRSGTRPTFDQVTGISSGSLIGAYAFLGPKYDAPMQRLILTMTSSDLIKFRPLYCMLLDGAFGSAKPAERLIRRAFDEHFMADLRCAYAEGRRLFIGTMNLETKRLAIWDLGAIASSGRPDADDLVRKVLLAAVSWPGAVPPVAFDVEVDGCRHREEHCDAGSVAMVLPPIGPFNTPYPLCFGAEKGKVSSDLYVLASRKLYSDPEPVPHRALHRLKPSVTAIFEALTRADVSHLYSLCLLSGMRFHLLAVPQGYHGEAPSIANLYPKEAPQLFAIGYHIGAGGPCWRYTPPGAEAGEEVAPRDGREIRCRTW